MALLRFYQLPAERVGGDQNFEGDDERHQLLLMDGVDEALKQRALRRYAHHKPFYEAEAMRQVQQGDLSVRELWERVAPHSELLEWQLRVRAEQNWATEERQVGARLAELATYSEHELEMVNSGGDFRFQQLNSRLLACSKQAQRDVLCPKVARQLGCESVKAID